MREIALLCPMSHGFAVHFLSHHPSVAGDKWSRPTGSLPHALEGDEAGEDAEGGADAVVHGGAQFVEEA